MNSCFKYLSLATLAALAAASAHAQSPANPDPAAVRGGNYTVEPEHTQIVFKLSHMGFTTYYGNFSHVTGSLRLDPRDASIDSLNVTVPVASVSTTSDKLDDELKGADWFDATKYPTVSFRSERVTVTGPGQATISGELTMHGVTRPVTLQARFNGAGSNPLSHAYTVGFEVSGHVRRSEFGVTKYVPVVGDDVDLMISAAFERQP